MTELTITIPGRPPTPNDRGNQVVQWRHAKAWRKTAMGCAQDAMPLGWEPLERCRLEVTFVVHDLRARDLDNLVASTKPLTDGLVDGGILKDDSDRVIESVTYRVRYERGVKATVYRITSMPSDQLGAGL
ncbi:MAG: RusA family crossover junction endodeoxyribonuclease [Chloroflexi bacterium]|nr:RusA family crossover junction endodeoxyribonuclease [Chloroflexota bacterium]